MGATGSCYPGRNGVGSGTEDQKVVQKGVFVA